MEYRLGREENEWNPLEICAKGREPKIEQKDIRISFSSKIEKKKKKFKERRKWFIRKRKEKKRKEKKGKERKALAFRAVTAITLGLLSSAFLHCWAISEDKVYQTWRGWLIFCDFTSI